MVREAFELITQALKDPKLARKVIEMKPEIQNCLSKIVEYLAQRLVAEDPVLTDELAVTETQTE